MIIYQSSVTDFCRAVDNNEIAFKIEQAFLDKFGRRIATSEKRSWVNSMHFMESVVRRSKVPDDCGILLEYNIPTTSKRIDFIISGRDDKEQENFIIIELKQWDKVEATNKDGLVRTFIGGNMREVPHPSYQASSYRQYLVDMNQAVYEGQLTAHACAYLHNFSQRSPEPLISDHYSKLVEEAPVYFRQDSDKLAKFISKYVGKGDGIQTLYAIERGKIKPSKRFVDYIHSLYKGNKDFIMLDEQKIAYENILHIAQFTTEKCTIIINGGPGTGKSVVAMSVFVELLKKRKNIQFIAPNASFRTAIEQALAGNGVARNRIKAVFSGSGRFYDASHNEFDILIVDEAHRLKKRGAYMYKGDNQVEDIVKAATVSVFFVDDLQKIRPTDVGSIDEIKRVATLYHSTVVEVELTAQFRCSGAEGYINWLDHTLQVQETANFDGWDAEAYEFEIMESPNELANKIYLLNSQGKKARLLAGYAWPWTNEKNGNPNAEVDDIVIAKHGFHMPWNARSSSTSWAFDPNGLKQIGCIHTSQGLEFDYVGVIIGDDLVYDPVNGEVHAVYDDYYDRDGRRGLKDKPDDLNALVKNIYKVLMSRGIYGCFVYCTNDELREYMKSRMKN